MAECYVVTELSWIASRDSLMKDDYKEKRVIRGVFEYFGDAKRYVEEMADIYYDGEFEWLFDGWDYVWYDRGVYSAREGGVRFSIRKNEYHPFDQESLKEW